MLFNNKKLVNTKKKTDVYIVTVRTVTENNDRDRDEDYDEDTRDEDDQPDDNREYHEFVLELHPSTKVDIVKEEIISVDDDDDIETDDVVQAKKPTSKNLSKIISETELKKYLDNGWKRGKNPIREEILTEIIIGLELVSHKKVLVYPKLPYFKRYFSDSWYSSEDGVMDTFVGYKLNYYDATGQKYTVAPKLEEADIEFIKNTEKKLRK